MNLIIFFGTIIFIQLINGQSQGGSGDPRELGMLMVDFENLLVTADGKLRGGRQPPTIKPMITKDDADDLDNLEKQFMQLQMMSEVTLKDINMRIDSLMNQGRNDEADEFRELSSRITAQAEKIKKKIIDLKNELSSTQGMKTTKKMEEGMPETMMPEMTMSMPESVVTKNQMEEKDMIEMMTPMAEDKITEMPMKPDKMDEERKSETEIKPKTTTTTKKTTKPKRPEPEDHQPINFFHELFRQKMKFKLEMMKAFKEKLANLARMKSFFLNGFNLFW